MVAIVSKMKVGPWTVTPAIVRATGPVMAPVGTLMTICAPPAMPVLLQLVAVPASTPPKVTVLLLCDGPKPVPVMVTGVPTTPVPGDMPVMAGGFVTVNGNALLKYPWLLTMTEPGPKG